MLKRAFSVLILPVVLLATASASAQDYCLAIRGNGELAPAHWGAVANVVERLGLPKMQAGGSSASITMFLLDAIASSKYLKKLTPEQRGRRAALLVKSLEGFAGYLTTTRQFGEFKTLYGNWTRLNQTESLQQLKSLFDLALQSGNPAAALDQQQVLVMSAIQTAVSVGLLNSKTVQAIENAVTAALATTDPAEADKQARLARFLVTESLESVRVFGEFDAATDANLFFRAGIVDFDQLAVQLGTIAQFYSARETTGAEDKMWKSFFSRCTDAAVGKQWPALSNACTEGFARLVDLAFDMEKKQNFSAELVGATIPSFPSTAVISGAGAEEIASAFKAYAENMDPQFGLNFRLAQSKDVAFGYWGDEDLLGRIKLSLPAGDEKSERFLSLGRASWQEVLSLSPAEPGLSPLKFFSHGGARNYVSAGGWSDLHPVRVLKAAGCENVVYVTRRGGESLFAQGVAKRLLGDEYKRDWKYLATKPKANLDANTELNNKGDTSDMSSLWSRLYNLGNPKSSFRLALDSADAVLCTDWNRFKIQEGPRTMIADSYTSPYYVPATSGLRDKAKLTPLLNKADLAEAGYPKYVGCF